MRIPLPKPAAQAFTIAEVLIASTVSAAMFAALLLTAMALNHTFSAAQDFSIATSEQQRAIDYIARDLRRAFTVTVAPDGKSLSMSIPDCYAAYDASGNPTGVSVDLNSTSKYPAGLPVTPVIKNGVVNYGDPAKPLTISYSIVGQQLLRQQTIAATGATSTLVICNYAADFQSTFQDTTSIVNFSITFAPNFEVAAGRDASARPMTTLTASTSVRNLRRD